MPTLVDDLQDQDTATLNGRLQQAAHDRTWAQTFSNTPPTEVLRANRNYDDLIKQAADRTLAIRAQTDPVAQKMLFDQKLQPLKEELERGRISHETASTLAAGATTRFHQAQDTETMGHIVGFADHMEKAPPVDSPQYAPYVLQGVQKFPRMATTAWGKETLGKLAAEHDTIQSLKSQIPPGFEIETITAGGGKQSHVTAKRSGEDHGDIASELKTGYGLTPGQIKNPVAVSVGNFDSGGTFKGDHKGGTVEITTGKGGEKVHMSTAEYERFGGQYSPETLAARKQAQPEPAASTATKSSEVKTQAEYDALPAGSEFVFQGKRGKKPAAH